MARQPEHREHVISTRPDSVEWGYFDASKPATLTVKSGDIIEVECPLAGSKDLESLGAPPEMITEIARTLENGVPANDRSSGPNILVGPIAVAGAEPGDVLEVKILELHPMDDYALNLFVGGGILSEDFTASKVRFIPLDKKRNVALFASNVEIPLRPFFGTMGVAPPLLQGRVGDGPPDFFGGNLDNKDLVVGTSLYLPIQVKGALFSVGDGHVGQGDGEVDSTALEVALRGKLQLTVHKNMHLARPRAETPNAYITMGFSPDLNRAAVQAVREMVDFLMTERHLSREDAFMLTSVAADLHVTQIVDGTKGIHAVLPKYIFLQK